RVLTLGRQPVADISLRGHTTRDPATCSNRVLMPAPSAAIRSIAGGHAKILGLRPRARLSHRTNSGVETTSLSAITNDSPAAPGVSRQANIPSTKLPTKRRLLWFLMLPTGSGTPFPIADTRVAILPGASGP